jgi:hypothetical protein
MGLLESARAVLDAGVLEPAADFGREPQAVAFARQADRGAVMFLLRRATGDWMAIIALLERRDGAWYEVTLVHKPWWDPAEAFADDELMATGGHSRFATGSAPEIVLIPGQAAPDTSIERADVSSDDEINVHPPWGHFIYLGERDRSDQTVKLTARRAGREQTAAFEPIGER